MSSKKLSREQRKLERARSRQRDARSTVSIGILTAAVCMMNSTSLHHNVSVEQPRLLALQQTGMVTVDPSPSSVTASSPPSRVFAVSVRRTTWMCESIARERAHVATLELVLLEDLRQSQNASCPDFLRGLTNRLGCLVFQADATRSLVRFSLGETYMRSLHERLSAMPSIDPLDESLETEPLRLYDVGPDGNGFLPTPEGIAAWEEMRSRLVRRKSALAKALPPPFHPNA